MTLSGDDEPPVLSRRGVGCGSCSCWLSLDGQCRWVVPFGGLPGELLPSCGHACGDLFLLGGQSFDEPVFVVVLGLLLGVGDELPCRLGVLGDEVGSADACSAYSLASCSGLACHRFSLLCGAGVVYGDSRLSLNAVPLELVTRGSGAAFVILAGLVA